jgi:phosphohistidine phosphatase SixA
VKTSAAVSLRRRALCAVLAFAAPSARARDAPAPVLVLRHAATDPGVGDPPGFRLDQCSTQRNLSPAGREQALAIGRRLRAEGWLPRQIRSSRWCRCLDTATLIAEGLGVPLRPQPWPALDSFFGSRGSQAEQTALLRERLTASRDAGFELWVTHQVNISALTGRATAMGDGLWLSPGAGDAVDARPFD